MGLRYRSASAAHLQSIANEVTELAGSDARGPAHPLDGVAWYDELAKRALVDVGDVPDPAVAVAQAEYVVRMHEPEHAGRVHD